MQHIWKAHLFLFITSIIQGFNFSIAKIVMPEYVSPGAIIIIRGVSAALFFWLISLMMKTEKPVREDYPRLLFCTLTGIVLNQLLFYKGLSLTQPINASLMVTISPVMVLIISALTLGERINYKKILGIFLGAGGVVLLLLSSSRKGPENLFIGDLLILINATSYASFLVAVKPLMLKYHPITVLKWIFLTGLIFVIPFGYPGIKNISWETMPGEAVLALLFVVVFATVIAYYLNTGVLKTIDPSLAGIYIYIQPILAAIIAIAMGKDQLTVNKTLFSLMILIGVYLVSSGQRQRKSLEPV